MIKDCPVCRLANPPEAQRCDCGYDFQAGVMQDSYLTDKDKLRAAEDAEANATQYNVFSFSGLLKALGINLSKLFGK